MGAKTGTSLLTAAVLASIVAGCGGSSKSSSTSTSSSTIAKAEFIKRADAICAASAQQTRAIQFPNVDPTKATKAQLPQLALPLSRLSVAFHVEATTLSRLPAP